MDGWSVIIRGALDVVSWACLLGGSFFVVIGGVGVLRLPDFFTRLHAGGITDTMGAGLILLGLIFQAGFTLTLLKVIMILLFLLATTPTACHALAHAALVQGLVPWQATGSPEKLVDGRPAAVESGDNDADGRPRDGVPFGRGSVDET